MEIESIITIIIATVTIVGSVFGVIKYFNKQMQEQISSVNKQLKEQIDKIDISNEKYRDELRKELKEYKNEIKNINNDLYEKYNNLEDKFLSVNVFIEYKNNNDRFLKKIEEDIDSLSKEFMFSLNEIKKDSNCSFEKVYASISDINNNLTKILIKLGT